MKDETSLRILELQKNLHKTNLFHIDEFAIMKYDDIMKLALERGFYFPSCEIYSDAQAGFWEYGPAGVSLKNKFLELWRRELIRRDRMIEIDGSQIMSKSVFEASGHLASFADPIVRCTKCKSTHRADKIIVEVTKTEIPESAWS